MKLFHFFAFGAAITLPLTAAAQSRTITLDPGLYDFTHVVHVNGQRQKVDDYEYCIEDGRNSKTIDEIAAELIEDGQCTLSNVVVTQSMGRADLSCIEPNFGMPLNGQMEADYGVDYYIINASSNINGVPITVKTSVNRRSECPIGWDNPDDVSAD